MDRATLGQHGIRYRFSFLAGQPFYDENGEIEGFYVAEPKWREEDLTPEDEVELQGWIAEHLAGRPDDDPLWVRWATLEHNGVEHYHRKGKLLREERPALGYYCAMCEAAIVAKNPGDYQFVGGPWNGRWVVTDGRPEWKVPIPTPITVDEFQRPALTMNIATYRRRGDRYLVD